jgi:xanthine/uracil/vitamin C permease (AzgA family)
MAELAATLRRSALDGYFKFAENGTTLGRDTMAGVTTFIVMSYIIFLNPAILGLGGDGLPLPGALTSTCLVAGVMTIIMGSTPIGPTPSRLASASTPSSPSASSWGRGWGSPRRWGSSSWRVRS